ncbi:hypothetical protein ON010_g4157 [Phytophthora cinnamomi]|nr:hypothetical protein ON010_g4157 [Phytophthora cinnamomi]
MAGGFADDAAAFLEGDARVVPRRALDLLSTLSPASLQSLASAAASAMATDLAHSVDTHPNAAELPSPSDSEAFAAMCAIVATYTSKLFNFIPDLTGFLLVCYAAQQTAALRSRSGGRRPAAEALASAGCRCAERGARAREYQFRLRPRGGRVVAAGLRAALQQRRQRPRAAVLRRAEAAVA